MKRLLAITLIALPLAVCAQNAENTASVDQWRVTPPPPWNASAADLELKGDQLRSQKAYADALDYYRAALEKTPKKDRSVLYNKSGMAELHLSRLDDAQRDFVNAIKRDKKNADAVNNLGVVYYLKQKYSKAIKSYEKALELNPRLAPYHSNLGRAFFAAKQFEKAAIEYGRALDLDPDIFIRNSPAGITARMGLPEDRGRYSFVLAKLFAGRGKNEESLLYLKRALEERYSGINKVYEDNEFAALRKDRRFNELMASGRLAEPQ